MNKLKAVLLFLGVFALYVLTRSPALDEHDSVQFAMGILDFNMWKDQPHAPGYPLFIFLGWIGHRFFGASPDLSLHVISALGGALFVMSWFLIVRLQFNERFAWWIAACLTITPAVWMTATKALTDSLACGFLSTEILCALLFVNAPSKLDGFKPSSSRWLGLMALAGAAAAGVRPQLFPVALVIILTALWQRRATMRMSILALIVFVTGCLLWLLPMSYLQWRLRPELSFWSVFPNLAWHQWQWRLDKPGVYLGAGDWSMRYLGTRAVFHFLGWFGLGFGLIKSPFVLVTGSLLIIAGLTIYFLRARKLGDWSFWRMHAPWALIHTAIIFISLSPAQRYYVIIFPLLLVPLLRGFLQLAPPWRWSVAAVPAFLLYIATPLAIENHRVEPPALRLVRYLTALYPKSRRPDVVLLFNKVRRHAQWYAPEFVTLHDLSSPDEVARAAGGSSAVYTDDPKIALPPGWHRIPLAVFARSGIIYWKHHAVELYLIDRPAR